MPSETVRWMARRGLDLRPRVVFRRAPLRRIPVMGGLIVAVMNVKQRRRPDGGVGPSPPWRGRAGWLGLRADQLAGRRTCGAKRRLVFRVGVLGKTTGNPREVKRPSPRAVVVRAHWTAPATCVHRVDGGAGQRPSADIPIPTRFSCSRRIYRVEVKPEKDGGGARPRQHRFRTRSQTGHLRDTRPAISPPSRVTKTKKALSCSTCL